MKPQIPEKMPTPLSELNLGGNGIHPPVVTAYEYNKLIDYLTARQELEDTRYKELTSRIDTIAGNQLEMKRGDQPIFQDIAPEEEADDDGIDWDERDEEHRKRNGAKVKDQVSFTKAELCELLLNLQEQHHQELQKAREEERERAIEIVKDELRTAPLEVQMTKGIVFASIVGRIRSELNQDISK